MDTGPLGNGKMRQESQRFPDRATAGLGGGGRNPGPWWLGREEEITPGPPTSVQLCTRYQLVESQATHLTYKTTKKKKNRCVLF